MGGTGQGSCDREFWGWPGRVRPFLRVWALVRVHVCNPGV